MGIQSARCTIVSKCTTRERWKKINKNIQDENILPVTYNHFNFYVILSIRCVILSAFTSFLPAQNYYNIIRNPIHIAIISFEIFAIKQQTFDRYSLSYCTRIYRYNLSQLLDHPVRYNIINCGRLLPLKTFFFSIFESHALILIRSVYNKSNIVTIK